MQTSREGFSYPRARKENNFLFLTPTPWEDACRRKPNTKRHLSLRPRAKAPRHSVLTFGQCREHGAWQPEKSPRDEGTSLFQGSSRGGRRIPAYTCWWEPPARCHPASARRAAWEEQETSTYSLEICNYFVLLRTWQGFLLKCHFSYFPGLTSCRQTFFASSVQGARNLLDAMFNVTLNI